ncbi:hypothetical protein BASA81_000131 [Batrachochytrium salamandrivorans]|nr:hypothetical protein BASA81_000131 [Batrachochytrium salamandrivorans]
MSSSGLFLHPLVMMGMSDHFTREKLLGGQRAIGGFVGVQEGLKISLLDYTEMKLSVPGLEIDLALLKRKLELITKVFPKYEFLGWYVVGAALSEQEMMVIQKQVQGLNESPLVVFMDSELSSPTAAGKSNKVLPITAYETVLQMRNDVSVQSFVELTLQIETTDSERVIVDHVNSGGNSNQNDDTFTPHMATLKNAVQKLTERVLIIRQFLAQCATTGGARVDQKLVREAIACVNLLPALDAEVSAAQFNEQLSDTLLLSLLANLTKQTTATSQVLEKFFIAFPSPGETAEGNSGGSKPLKRSSSTTNASPAAPPSALGRKA